jgi:hypothetical protein
MGILPTMDEPLLQLHHWHPVDDVVFFESSKIEMDAFTLLMKSHASTLHPGGISFLFIETCLESI